MIPHNVHVDNDPQDAEDEDTEYCGVCLEPIAECYCNEETDEVTPELDL